jgi:hypothetical protein
MAASGITRRLAWAGVPALLLAILVAVWNWDWFIPIVQSRASAALGRTVTISHLHLRLGRVVQVVADDVVVANPPDWPSGDPPFVAIHVLTIQAPTSGCRPAAVAERRQRSAICASPTETRISCSPS